MYMKDNEQYPTIQTKYKLKMYFIGGTMFSTELTDEGLEHFKNIIQNPKVMKKNNYIITFGDTHGVNISNLNSYEIIEEELQ